MLRELSKLVLAFLLFATPAAAGSRELSAALKLAGANAAELTKALNDLPPDYRPAGEFLIENMPAVDLAQMSAEVLRENVILAYKTRDLFPWNRQIPDEIFLYYVLPYRVTQEPISNWRPMFFDSLYPRVKTCTSMTQVALEVNRWCGERVKYKPNAPRDQGPLQTLKSGWGRCEEMMIVHICACRALGIPAREAYTPYWPMTESNHAWSEVWIDGKWPYVGACEPSSVLGDAWFNSAAKQAALVMTVCFGVPKGETAFYRKGKGYAIINHTADYTQTGIISVRVTRGKKPQRNVPVCFSVFNFGGLRPIARDSTGQDGVASLQIGEGEYFVSAGFPGRICSRIVECTANAVREAVFDLGQPEPAPEKFWLWCKQVQ
jgi:hypothetical protein